VHGGRRERRGVGGGGAVWGERGEGLGGGGERGRAVWGEKGEELCGELCGERE